MPMSKKLKICLDIDNVIVDFLGQFIRVFNLKKNTRLVISDITSFLPHESLESLISENDWDDIFAYCEENGLYATLKSYDGARTSIENLMKEGHEVYCLTARNSKFRGETEMSFLLNGLPNLKIYYAPKSKYRMLKKLAPDVFVDDSLTNCEEALKANVKSIYIMDQPYNRVEESKPFKRVTSLIQVERDIVKEKSSGKSN